MTTDLLGLLCDLLLDGMLVLLHELLHRLLADEVMALEVFMIGDSLLVLLCRAESIPFDGVLVSEAIRPDDLIHTIVGTI